MKKGFTLVELSIVLVIIGLLIGGILAAQSMITTAKINAQIVQIQQMDTAVLNFRNKYNSLPGDSLLFPSPGDGDGILENSEVQAGTQAHSMNAYDYEMPNFWYHLSLDGFLPDNVVYSNSVASGLRPGVNIPTSKYDKKVSVAVLHVTPPNKSPFYFLCDFSLSTNPTLWRAALTSSDAYALDRKIDDGIARQANMATYTGIMFATTGFGTCYAATIPNYDTSISGKSCCVLISIGSQAGAVH